MFSLLDCRPVIVLFIQIIPSHLVDPNSKDPLVYGINSLCKKLSLNEFIDVENCRMAIIEY